MKLIQLGYEIIEQEPGLKGLYKAAEIPGRVCYASTDKMTENSAKPFIDNLMNLNHGAPLEHGTVYLEIPDLAVRQNKINGTNFVYEFYLENHYSRVGKKVDDNWYVTTNLRVLFENKLLDDLRYLVNEPSEYHEQRVMVKFTANRGVSAEYNRHRNDSINEESTRYCNYSKDKFGNEITVTENNEKFSGRIDDLEERNIANDIYQYCALIGEHKDDGFDDIDFWLFANKASEYSYVNLINKCGWKAQNARDVLPFDLRSNLIHTAYISDWIHFFNLRAIGTTGTPHPQAKELAYPLMEEFIQRGLIDKKDLDFKNGKN